VDTEPDREQDHDRSGRPRDGREPCQPVEDPELISQLLSKHAGNQLLGRLTPREDDNRRVLAVLAYLNA
jgi:hypothetical protein